MGKRSLDEIRSTARLEPIETASRDEITALQLERLKTTLRRAYDNVAHYRTTFDAVGAHPDSITSLADLAAFPFTTKHDLRANYPFGLFAVPRSDVVRVHASSGTTGKPTVVGYTRNDIDTWANIMARSIRAAGGRPGDVAHVAYGYGLFTGGLGAHYGAERLGCTVVPMSGGQTEKQVQLICDFGADIILVTPSYFLAIAEEMQRQGIDPAGTNLKVGIFGAEPWSGELRNRIESLFNMHAVDLYGISEIMGPGVAGECVESKDGPVVWEDHFYPEIIDPDTGEVLPDGEFGELVVTSLTKEAFPVIRYRTRDLTALLPPTSRSMRRLARISARTDDMLIIRGVNMFPTQVEEILVSEPLLAPHYLIEVTRPHNLDEIAVFVEAADPSVTATQREVAGAELHARIKSLIGVSATVEVRDSGSLERSLGKAKRVNDLRPRSE